jgi:hydrogenase expression/formation protein HypE
MSDCIQLAHGGGGTLMQQLINQELRALYTDPAQVLHDAARLELPPGPLAFSTDGYVVQPLEFPGGDIGSLAVIGTANDLAMAGARPLHLSVALLLEEGLPLALLRRLVASMAAAAAGEGARPTAYLSPPVASGRYRRRRRSTPRRYARAISCC